MDYYNGDTGQLRSLTAPRRNNYFYGKLMDELHFRMEQTYGNHKRWLLNRLTLGMGVLCGLDVLAEGNQVCVTPGVAIDALGREMMVPHRICVDPWQLTDECGQPTGRRPAGENPQVYICLAYAECAADHMPVLVGDCNTREESAPGTIVETFRLLVLEGLPLTSEQQQEQQRRDELLCHAVSGAGARSTLQDQRRHLCSELPRDCIRPEGVCVPLAVVPLLAGDTIGEIDTCSYRPVVYSNAVLLDMILCLADRIEACCGERPPERPPVRIAIRPDALPGGRVGVPYPAATISASGGTAPYTLQIANGNVPPGLSAMPAGDDSLKLEGTPTQAGAFGFTVRAEDASGADTERGYTVVIDRREESPEALRVRAVLFLERRDDELEAFDDLRPDGEYQFQFGRLRGIRVFFTDRVDISTVTTAGTRSEPRERFSFLVLRNDQVLPGRIIQESPLSATFLPAEEIDEVFPTGQYHVILFGDDGPQRRAIRGRSDVEPARLDGEGLRPGFPPSGDGSEGGNFEFRFEVA
ncbi:MAG TPA: Ig domain-containing protein [Herpetosiphonaceae bacterium]|nr:Ig domain-containing protein [Herpetosiphonaceae bacterium]